MPPRRFKVSDESLNSKGYWVLTKGIGIPASNTVPLFYNHELEGKLALGKWKNFRFEEDGSLTAEVEFDEQDSFALELQRKVDAGFITMCSMGFLVVESSKDKKLLKPGQARPTVTKSRLLEISVCPIGSNENSVKLSAEQTEDVMLPIIEQNENRKMETLKELLKARGIALQTLGLADDATEEAIMAAIQKLAAQKATEEVPLTTEEKLADKVVAYGRMIGVVNTENEPHYKKLALADSESTMKILSFYVSIDEVGKKGKNPESVKATDKDVKLTALVEFLKGKQDLNLQEGEGQNKPKAKTLAERLLIS
jgi:HK97 family phage prohead protease